MKNILLSASAEATEIKGRLMDERIKELFAAILEIPENGLSDSTTPDDIESWDSYKQMFLIASFEEEFEISIEPEEIVDMYTTFEQFKKVILSKIN